jgi:predicted metal-dependent hydrolase
MDYDPRYLAGILFFNDRDFFEAHEVWEDVWTESSGPERRFYQGLIQAAVALHHFRNGNVRGALKLYRTGRAYMEPLDGPFFGLDKAVFWERMADCFQELHASADPDRRVLLDESKIPTITLTPPPTSWPDPETFVDDED